VAHDFVEPLLGSDKRRGHPAQNHFAVLPVGKRGGLDAYTGVRALDDVGCRQAAMQRGRKIQPVDGKAFLQAFQQAGRGEG